MTVPPLSGAVSRVQVSVWLGSRSPTWTLAVMSVAPAFLLTVRVETTPLKAGAVLRVVKLKVASLAMAATLLPAASCSAAAPIRML